MDVLFTVLKNMVLEQVDNTRECTDKEIMKIIDRVIISYKTRFISLQDRMKFREELFNSLRRYDVLQRLIDNDDISEIMVNGRNNIFYEKNGYLYKWNKTFSSEEKLEDVVMKIVSETNRSVNERTPIVDARLDNGSRINVVLSPISIDGTAVTIRRFPDNPLTMEKLLQLQSIQKREADYLISAVRNKKSILVSGGTGSGKTSFLNILCDYLEADERVVTIEEAAELKIRSVENLVRLESRNSNSEGVGSISIRDLLKTALRMRPDRLILGEVRGTEAIDLLQALNTGHAGSLSTIHANSCQDVFSRLETLVLMGMDIPLEAVKRQIASSINLLVHLERRPDKSRRLKEIVKIKGYREGCILTESLFCENDI